MSIASIGTNGNAAWARYGIASVERDLDRAMTQLSTGKRTSSASIDAAGVGMAENLEAEMRGYKMGARSAFDAATAAAAADALLDEVSDITQRMRELAVQQLSGTLTSSQTGDIDTELTELNLMATALLGSGTWNGVSLNGITIAAAFGQDGGTTYAIAGPSTAVSAAAASATVATLQTALETIASARAGLGASVNALNAAGEHQLALAGAAAEGLSRAEDTDYAEATAELARAQIVQQAAMAMAAQANQQPATVLALLR